MIVRYWRYGGALHYCGAVPPRGLKTMAEQRAPTDDLLERRRRQALRALIDEMLSEIRLAASRENWTPESRALAESDLARIMEQVRREALADHQNR